MSDGHFCVIYLCMRHIVHAVSHVKVGLRMLKIIESNDLMLDAISRRTFFLRPSSGDLPIVEKRTRVPHPFST